MRKRKVIIEHRRGPQRKGAAHWLTMWFIVYPAIGAGTVLIGCALVGLWLVWAAQALVGLVRHRPTSPLWLRPQLKSGMDRVSDFINAQSGRKS